MRRSRDVRTSSHRRPPLMQLLVISPGTREYRHYFGSPSRQIGPSVKGLFIHTCLTSSYLFYIQIINRPYTTENPTTSRDIGQTSAQTQFT